jgi:hypothetical protein
MWHICAQDRGCGLWSGAGGSAYLLANGIGQMGTSPAGRFLLMLEGRFGASGVTGNLNILGSMGYATNASFSSAPVIYAGTGSGYIWQYYEKPILQFFGKF